MSAGRTMKRVTKLSALVLVLTLLFVYLAPATQDGSFPFLSEPKDKDRAEKPAEGKPSVKDDSDGQTFSGSGKVGSSSAGPSNSSTGASPTDSSPTGSPPNDGSTDPDVDPENVPLAVSLGEIEFLYPGKLRAIPLTIGNPYAWDIVLSRVTVSSEVSDTPDCPTSFLSLGVYDITGPMIPANSTGTAATEIALKPSAPEACQGARFEIHVKVEAGRI